MCKRSCDLIFHNNSLINIFCCFLGLHMHVNALHLQEYFTLTSATYGNIQSQYKALLTPFKQRFTLNDKKYEKITFICSLSTGASRVLSALSSTQRKVYNFLETGSTNEEKTCFICSLYIKNILS